MTKIKHNKNKNGKTKKIHNIFVNNILIDPQRPKPDEQRVAEIANSIRDIGLLNKIIVSPDKKQSGKYRLVAGYHRLAAYEFMKREKIPAIVYEGDELHQELVEIDENLMRKNLHYTERATAFKRRKEIYDKLFPEVVRPKGGRPSKNSASSAPFTEDTAFKSGLSQRTVQQDLQIAELCSGTLQLLKEKDVPQKQALKLVQLPEDERQKAIEKIKNGDSHGLKGKKARNERAKDLVPLKMKFVRPDIEKIMQIVRDAKQHNHIDEDAEALLRICTYYAEHELEQHADTSIDGNNE